jgi:hypothetical protein
MKSAFTTSNQGDTDVFIVHVKPTELNEVSRLSFSMILKTHQENIPPTELINNL